MTITEHLEAYAAARDKQRTAAAQQPRQPSRPAWKPGDLVTFDVDVMPRVLVQELGGATSGIVAEVARGERVAVRIADRADLFWCNSGVLLRDEQQSLF